MKICIASDHRGFSLKQELLKYLKTKYNITDIGPFTNEMTDYTKYGIMVGEKIKNKEYDFGILICGSGIGISIAANKVKKVRCAKVSSVEEAKLTRKDNDANVIALDGNMNISEKIEIVEAFLNTPFSELERYKKRLKQIEMYENGENIEW